MKKITLTVTAIISIVFACAQSGAVSLNSSALNIDYLETVLHGKYAIKRNMLGWYIDSWCPLPTPPDKPTFWLAANGGIKFFTNVTIPGVGSTRDIITSSMVITHNGNVGIGTEYPTQRLHIVDGNILISRTSSGAKAPASRNGSIMFGDFQSEDENPLGVWAIEYLSGGPENAGLNFWQHGVGNYFLFLRNNGNIGMGTNNPMYKLDVIGTVRAQELIIDMNGEPSADYVFAPDYELAPLTEVETYVMTNRHLPDIPSEVEMQKEGMKLQEFQVQLLRKIEELTLYVIEQDKTIRALEQEVEQLKK